jgi:hypothetical protein
MKYIVVALILTACSDMSPEHLALVHDAPELDVDCSITKTKTQTAPDGTIHRQTQWYAEPDVLMFHTENFWVQTCTDAFVPPCPMGWTCDGDKQVPESCHITQNSGEFVGFRLRIFCGYEHAVQEPGLPTRVVWEYTEPKIRVWAITAP